MSKSLETKVISFGNAKEAALYFERVLPFDLGSTALRDSNIPNFVPKSDFSSVAPDDKSVFDAVFELTGNEKSADLYLAQAIIMPLAKVLLSQELGDPPDNVNIFVQDPEFERVREKLKKGVGIDLQKLVRSADNNYKEAADKLIASLSRRVVESDFGRASAWVSFDNASTSKRPEVYQNSDKFQAVVSNIELVDLTKVEWERILEFRRDKDSRLALRKFRSFFFENYSSLEPQEILDKLLISHEQQRVVLKQWGMQTVSKALSVGFDNSAAIGGSLSALAGMTAGGPLGALVGLSVPIGRMFLEVGKAVQERTMLKINSPLEFMSRVQKLDD